jgi:hypothetical protein
VHDCDSKKAHKAITSSLKQAHSKNHHEQSSSLLTYLAKVYVEMAVAEVIETEKEFGAEVDTLVG